MVEPFTIVVAVLGTIIFITLFRAICLYVCACVHPTPAARPAIPVHVVAVTYPPPSYQEGGTLALERLLDKLQEILKPQLFEAVQKAENARKRQKEKGDNKADNAAKTQPQGDSETERLPPFEGDGDSGAAAPAAAGKSSAASRSRPPMASAASSISRRGEEEDRPSCVICMDTFKAQDIVYQLPCRHIYHTECVMPWFRKSRTGLCPLCKADVLHVPPARTKQRAQHVEIEL